MKGKLLIVLLSLMLAFGMIIASCDDGVLADTLGTATNTVGEEENKIGIGIKEDPSTHNTGIKEWIEAFPRKP
jgi:hypothetical protein